MGFFISSLLKRLMTKIEWGHRGQTTVVAPSTELVFAALTG
jgi:hypothetical protein